MVFGGSFFVVIFESKFPRLLCVGREVEDGDMRVVTATEKDVFFMSVDFSSER